MCSRTHSNGDAPTSQCRHAPPVATCRTILSQKRPVAKRLEPAHDGCGGPNHGGGSPPGVRSSVGFLYLRTSALSHAGQVVLSSCPGERRSLPMGALRDTKDMLSRVQAVDTTDAGRPQAHVVHLPGSHLSMAMPLLGNATTRSRLRYGIRRSGCGP